MKSTSATRKTQSSLLGVAASVPSMKMTPKHAGSLSTDCEGSYDTAMPPGRANNDVAWRAMLEGRVIALAEQNADLKEQLKELRPQNDSKLLIAVASATLAVVIAVLGGGRWMLAEFDNRLDDHSTRPHKGVAEEYETKKSAEWRYEQLRRRLERLEAR